jgi:hypothetical protein
MHCEKSRELSYEMHLSLPGLGPALRQSLLCCHTPESTQEKVRFELFPSSVGDPWCLSQIPDPNFFHPGSEFFHSGSASKNLGILTQKIVSKFSNPDPGSRGQKGTGSRIRNTVSESDF